MISGSSTSGGDNLGTRKTPNVFNIQTPVAIAIGVRAPKPSPGTPAKVHYAKIEGVTREDKLAHLEDIGGFGGIAWHDCPSDWHKPFLPIGKGDYSDWPKIEDIFPWTHSGAQFKRSWPIGETLSVLSERYSRLVAADPKKRKPLFKESLDRRVTWRPADESLVSVFELTSAATEPPIGRYAFRSFDRQYGILDPRFGDYLRGELQKTLGVQCFFTTLLTTPLGFGAALTVSSDLPDLHHFRGSFGGKDVIPLYRDAAGAEPNVTGGLLDALGKEYGATPATGDLAAYVYAVLGGRPIRGASGTSLKRPGHVCRLQRTVQPLPRAPNLAAN
jgi:Type ISP C-terminal specificity domain